MQEATNCVKVSIRLPCDDFVDLEVAHELPVRDLMTSLEEQQIGLKRNQFHLLYRKEKMSQEHGLDHYNTTRKQTMTLEALVDCTDNMEMRYDDFIESFQLSTASQNMKNVPVEVYFTLRFKVNATGHALYLPALVDSECIHSLINDAESNRMVLELGEEGARDRGFQQWTTEKNMILKKRIHLIKVTDPKLEYDPSYCLYDSLSPLNAGYSSGDGASWQRYTTSAPRACLIHIDQLEMQMRVIPEEPLEYDTCYAILLQNGVPCPPDFELDGPLLGFSNSAGVRHDKLFFFSTEKGSDSFGYGMY